MARILCIFGLLCFVLCSVENTEIEDLYGNLQLQPESLPYVKRLQNGRESENKENILELLHKLSISENGITHRESEDSEEQKKNRRGAGNGSSTPKPCRYLYWKSWASC
ncbi:unnamed protein product [Menidia menidia]|uniref:(Atlantic silverside) hypothetical protein n=1 Tax=Menidia menidia TaxID=238744 RepID=A0A8S4AXQ1_9TELE|nr:unnamed protein product [Menidia menidia]